MSGLLNNSLFLSTAAAAGGYQIERSLRFNSSDSGFCSRTPAVAGNRKTWTWAGWVKRSQLGTFQNLFGTADAGFANGTYFLLIDDNTLSVEEYGASSFTWRVRSTQVFRDASAWGHLLVACDTTQATASNRVRIYWNGTEITSFSTANYPTQNLDTSLNTASLHGIGRAGLYNSYYFNGYLADIHFIDGQALTPSSFTEVSATTGQLIPKAYSGGSYGTNGFYLQFADNSSNTATTLGKDTSGNSNNWTPNNFAVLDGNGNYLEGWTASSGFYSPYLISRGFDGIYGPTLNEMALTLGTSMTWAPSTSVSTGSSFRIFTYPAGGFNSGYIVTVGAVSQTVATSPTLGEWMNLTSLTGLTINTSTPLVITTNGGSRAGFSAIEINGVILLDDGVVGPTNDSLVDTPTSYGTGNSGGDVRGNYATLNPLDLADFTLSNGNLNYSKTSTTWKSVRATVGVNSGKWYYEYQFGSDSRHYIGISQSSMAIATYPGATSTSYSIYLYNGDKSNNGVDSSYASAFTSTDILGVAFDLDAATVTFYKNGTSLGTAFTGIASGYYFPTFGTYLSGETGTVNFGQRAFAYPVSGYKALVDTNLPAPVVAKPNTLFDVLTWSGNSATRTLTGLSFANNVGFAWVKNRSNAFNHVLQDAVRGFTTGKKLSSNITDSEGLAGNLDDSYGYISGASSTGFTIDKSGTGQDWCQMNQSGSTYVGWAWDAGTTTASNGSGSITSQVRANASAGFSVVTYTGSGSAATVGHGLGIAPGLVIVKCRSNTDDWLVYSATLGNFYLRLQSTDAAVAASSVVWNNTAPTSSVFSIGTSSGVNTSSRTYVAYCFAPVVGYSSAFSYTGNGDSSGPFVYLGFRPRFIIQKRTDSAGSWLMIDTARDPVNVARNELFANSSAAEYDNTSLIDVLSNGFKIRATFANMNASGGSFIGYAFAENPFQYARAR